MNKKIRRLRQEEKKLNKKANFLLQAKKIFMILTIIGISAWTLVLLIDRELAIQYLFIELINFIMIASIFFLDIEQEYLEKAADQKRENIKNLILIQK
jgi:uncharacterized membrane protein